MADDRAKKRADEVPQALAGEGLDEVLGVGLKRTVQSSGVSVGGLRSPLVASRAAPQPAAASEAKPAAPAAPRKEPERRRGKRRADGYPEISKIAGLDDSSYHILGDTTVTHLSHVMYDPGRGRPKRFLIVVVILVVAGLTGLMSYSPGYRRETWAKVKSAEKQFIQLARHPFKHDEIKDREFDVPATHGRRGRASHRLAASALRPRHNCLDLRQVAAGGAPMTASERVSLADCAWLQGDMADVEEALKPLQARLTHLGDKQLGGGDEALSEAFLSLVAARLAAGESRQVDELLSGRCGRWAPTPSCVGKLMLVASHARPGNVESDPRLSRLLRSRGVLGGGRIESRFWLAGARLARANGRNGLADHRYALALVSAKSAVALRKQIYETEAVDLYGRGEALRLKALTSRALADLRHLDVGARTKLLMLHDLVTSRNKRRTVKTLLTREEITYRACNDLDLVEILGPEAIRAGLEDDYARLIKRTRAHFTDKYPAMSRAARKRLAMWDIRLALARKQYNQAMNGLDVYEHENRADAVSHHLRGVTYLLSSDSERQALLAAHEFQVALRLKNSWESLDALGVALIRAGHPETVSGLIKDLSRRITTKGQRYWADMLKARWYIVTGKYPSAHKILKTWAAAEPDWVTPRQLLLQLDQKTGTTAEARKTQNELDDLARDQPYASSFEGFASPLGIMALGQRPID